MLEASAGTGKTYTIAALATRYVADGVDLGRLMMVTFGRMATDELRQRVRERMVASSDQLAAVLRWPAPPGRRRRPGPAADHRSDRGAQRDAAGGLSRALSDFDAATIATTHEFCLRMLDGLGVLGDREPHAVFVEQLTDLTAEVAARRLPAPVRRSTATRRCSFDQARASWRGRSSRRPTRAWSRAPRTTRTTGPSRSAPGRVRRTRCAPNCSGARTRPGCSATTTCSPGCGTRSPTPRTVTAAAARLRQRYRVVLVDEFQDTDPVQWEILRRAFHGHSTLIMIGDPKQAIYAFRGADVYSYLDAVRQADRVATLAVNWRSDQAVVDALDRLIGRRIPRRPGDRGPRGRAAHHRSAGASPATRRATAG